MTVYAGESCKEPYRVSLDSGFACSGKGCPSLATQLATPLKTTFNFSASLRSGKAPKYCLGIAKRTSRLKGRLAGVLHRADKFGYRDSHESGRDQPHKALIHGLALLERLGSVGGNCGNCSVRFKQFRRKCGETFLQMA